ncbi:MAG: radical SAM family heme chaperone HemW, partial [Crocosphaera sp.]|nr:radical SAM family heme chaperone HemW [Crocosphaera sp.]
DQQFGINSDAEISLEMDPGTFSLEQLFDYKKLGVNRFSVGVQSFNDQLLEKCGRFHRCQDIEQAINFIHQTNIQNFSVDLISGLPYQTKENWQFSLEQAIKIEPNHISCYDLVLEPVTAFGKQYKPGKFPLPDDNNTAEMYKIAQKVLRKAGYEHYEISNYAKLGYQSQHNLIYWENKPYYGLGMGAASYTNNQRFTRPRNRKDYYQWLKNLQQTGYSLSCDPLEKIDNLLETLMLGLRLKKGVDLLEIATSFGEKSVKKIYQTLLPYQKKGLVNFQYIGTSSIREINSDNWKRIKRIMLSDPDGFLLSNTILADLFDKLESTV